ncbi:MAG: hypothetical protein HQK57_12840 [Deltaproteobacteria bacterium]|nr:hypothetical protein [Deltaproteobacteria bacterium]MBF0525655.1 hypothetical protein [Deltaproteobacteria bacterium]
MGEILKIIDLMDPKEAVAEMAVALKRLFSLLDEEDRTHFITSLVGESSGDKVAGLVQL